MDRRKPRVFKEPFQLKIVRELITIGVSSLVILALLCIVVLFWGQAASVMQLQGSGRIVFLNLLKAFVVISVILLGLVLWISVLISRNLSDELEFHYISEPFNQLSDMIFTYKKELGELEEKISAFLEGNKKGTIKKTAALPFIEELKTKITALKKIS
ncbi:MAG: hypothetical protein B5M53_11150 [Candidatus Cloacimonas sp. 4484_209]|nr:MAG: hypothetical protein B5M53_11150 [Candidatus Cloacimonas sp. 4484_209]